MLSRCSYSVVIILAILKYEKYYIQHLHFDCILAISEGDLQNIHRKVMEQSMLYNCLYNVHSTVQLNSFHSSSLTETCHRQHAPAAQFNYVRQAEELLSAHLVSHGDK